MNWLLKWRIQNKQKQLLKEKEKLTLLIKQEELDNIINKTKESQEELMNKEEQNNNQFITRGKK